MICFVLLFETMECVDNSRGTQVICFVLLDEKMECNSLFASTRPTLCTYIRVEILGLDFW